MNYEKKTLQVISRNGFQSSMISCCLFGTKRFVSFSSQKIHILSMKQLVSNGALRETMSSPLILYGVLPGMAMIHLSKQLLILVIK